MDRRTICSLAVASAFSILLCAGTGALANEKIGLEFEYPRTRAAVYKNSYMYEYISDLGHQITGGGQSKWIEIIVDAEWTRWSGS